MENKINMVELLKECPRGMELDCTVFNNVTLECVSNESIWIKYIDSDGNSRVIHLTPHGEIELQHIKTECVIFPKGKTTWEGFIPPCKFKDGDILTTNLGSVFILKEPNENVFYYSCYVALNDVSRFITSYTKFCIKNGCRLATEEEKQKLFDAINANGYKWNAETKTLEKLIIPKFHEGQWITDGLVGGQITRTEDNYPCYKITDFMGGINTSIPFTLQDNYHLWTIQDAKDGDVLAAYECLVLFKKLDGLNIKCYCTYHFMNNPSFYVDTLQNKDAFHPATEEEKRKLFDAIKANGYLWNAETKTLEKLHKFKAPKTQEEINNYLSKISIKDANNLLSIEKRLEDDKLVLSDSILINKSSGISSSEFIEWYKYFEYPKTYEECCEVLDYEPDRQTVTGYDAELIENFQTLKLCRDAYWKIAGEQMGLGKPWEPNWEDENGYVFCIVNKCNNIGLTCEWLKENYILSFPTEKMRDAFYENFKDLIEACKELL